MKTTLTKTQPEHTDWAFEAELLHIAIAHGWVALGALRLLGENRDRAIRELRKEAEAAEGFEQPIERRRRAA